MEFLRAFLSRSLERKFVFFMVAMVAIAIVSVSSITTQGLREFILQSFQTRVTEKLSLAAIAVDDSDSGDGPDLTRARRLLISLHVDPDLVCIAYLDGRMRRQAEPLVNALPMGIELTPTILQSNDPILLYPQTGSDNYIAWTAPTRVGGVVAVFRKDGTERQLKNMNTRLLLVAGVVCILSCFLGLFMARLILRPLERFITAMRNITVGEEPQELATLDQNELGEWTRTFNLMIEQLRRKHDLEKFLLYREKSELVMHLAAGLAHRIRTPLTSISSLTQLITQGGDSRKLKEWTQVILTKVEQLDDAVGQFVSYAQPGPLHFEPCRLSESLEFSLSLLAPDLEAAQIAVSPQLQDESEPELLLDTQQIQQGLMNMIRNSIRSMPDGGKLTVQLTYPPVSQGAPGSARIRLEDTGHQIPEEIRERIFDPFVDMTVEHSGVALPVAARIFELHGGTTTLEYSEEHGNSFLITLPRLSLEELKLRSTQTD